MPATIWIYAPEAPPRLPDGLPIVPPTEVRVRRVLDYLRRDPIVTGSSAGIGRAISSETR